MTAPEVIRQFHGLYSGGLAQQKRDSGDAAAMPPWAETYWLGKQVVKCPMDLWVYQEILWETQPHVLLEAGTSGAGSAFFFASIFDRIGKGRVITVDTEYYPHLRVDHPRIKYITGSSVDPKIVAQMWSEAEGRVMVSLDSLHTYEHVKAELKAYGPKVSPGCYLVVEDTGWGAPGEPWASDAATEFLREHPEFVADEKCEKHLLTSNHGGWLKRLA